MLKEDGFSLAEVTIAFAILAICLLLVYGIMIRTFAISSRSEAKVIANNVAQEIMEDAANRPYANVALWAGAGTTVPTTYTVVEKYAGAIPYSEETIRVSSGTQSSFIPYQQQKTQAGINFQITTIVSWHDDSTDDLSPTDPDPHDYKRVHITVIWGSNPGAATSIVLDRFVSLYYKPDAHGSGTANAGEVRLTDIGATDYLKLGFSTSETYSGGDRTGKAEAKGAYTKNTVGEVNNTGDSVAWARAFTDDESHTPDVPTALEKTDGGSAITDGLISIQLPDASYRPAARTASGIVNVIGNNSYGSWHSGEFGSEGVWDNWEAPPNWDTGNTWNQPSAIAKSDSGYIAWSYSPSQDPVNFVEFFKSRTGSKLVTSSATQANKISLRNWTYNWKVQLIELNDIPGGEDLPELGLVRADEVKGWTETKGNGQDAGEAEVLWSITNLQIWDRTLHQYTTYPLVDKNNLLPAVDWPDPIDDTSVKIGTTSTSSDTSGATTSLTVLELKINAATIGTTSIPASTVTIGVLNNSVSYTWQ